MGIGAAFATGLVKGFTQNIKEEKARRLSDQEKIDAFEQIAFKSVLEGDATQSGYAAVTGLLKSAQQQMDDRPNIDLFGRATDGIDLDFSKMQGALAAASDDYVNIGSVKLRVSEDYFKASTSPEDQAQIFMNSLSKQMATPATQAAFLSQFKDEEDIRQLETMYRGQLGQYVRSRTFDSEGNKIVNVDPLSTLPAHEPMSNFLGWNVDKNYQTSMAAAASKIQQGSTELPPTYALLPVGLNGNKGAVAVPFKELLKEDQMENLNGLASYQGMDTQKFVYTFASQFDNQAEFMKGLGHATNLYGLGAGEPKSLDERFNVGEYMLSQPDLKNDAIARAYAMTPFVVDMRSPAETTMRKLGFEISKDLPFTEEFFKLTGQKLDAFEERTSSLYKARKNLTGLVETLNRSGLKAEGFIANTFLGVYGFFGKSGTIDQIKNLVTEGGGYADEKSGARIEAFMKSELQGVSDDVAAARTLAFIAAGDLARAEDPSGRLSDQDFLRNYKKLGINASGTLDNQITAINTVLDEVNMKYREVEVLSMIVSRGKGGKLTDGDRKLLQADSRAKDFVRNYYNQGGETIEETAPVAQLPSFEAVTTKTDRYEPYSLYVGKDGGAVYRDKQTSALIVTSNGAVTQQFAKGDSVKQAFTSGALVRSSAGAPGSLAPAPAPAANDAGSPPTPAPQPAPVTSAIEYLDVAGKESGNNQQGYTLEGYPGKYKKMTRPDGTQYFEPMK